MDALLLLIFGSFALSDVNYFCVRPHFIQESLIDEAVVENDVGLPQASQSFNCNQIGIARSRPHNEYKSERPHTSGARESWCSFLRLLTQPIVLRTNQFPKRSLAFRSAAYS